MKIEGGQGEDVAGVDVPFERAAERGADRHGHADAVGERTRDDQLRRLDALRTASPEDRRGPAWGHDVRGFLADLTGHALLHSDQQYRMQTPRSRIECEAESVAFCILHHFGLDVGEVAFGYLAHWGDGGNALTELLESGERIRSAAHQVIAWIEEQYVDVVAVGAEEPIQAWTEPVLA